MAIHINKTAMLQLQSASHQLTQTLRHHVTNTLPRLMTPIDWTTQRAGLFATGKRALTNQESAVEPALLPQTTP